MSPSQEDLVVHVDQEEEVVRAEVVEDPVVDVVDLVEKEVDMEAQEAAMVEAEVVVVVEEDQEEHPEEDMEVDVEEEKEEAEVVKTTSRLPIKHQHKSVSFHLLKHSLFE